MDDRFTKNESSPNLSSGEAQERHRSEPRYRVHRCPASLDVLENFPRSLNCEIFDVSRTGMRLDLKWPVSLFSQVRVETLGCEVAGEVRYCVRVGPTYHIGLKLYETIAADDFLAILHYRPETQDREP